MDKTKYEELTHSEQVDMYCQDVLNGEIPACEYVKAACRRHLDDLEKVDNDPDYPYFYDRNQVDKFCSFAELMVAVEGKWAG